MKKNVQLEKLLNEIASEAILKRLTEDPQRLDREDISRLLPEHIGIFLRKYPELAERFKGCRADLFSSSASGRDTPPTPCSTDPEPRDP